MRHFDNCQIDDIYFDTRNDIVTDLYIKMSNDKSRRKYAIAQYNSQIHCQMTTFTPNFKKCDNYR